MLFFLGVFAVLRGGGSGAAASAPQAPGQWSLSSQWWTFAHKTDEWLMAPSQMALRSIVYHFYYTHLHFHISYLHFLCRYKSESLWLIRPLLQSESEKEGRGLRKGRRRRRLIGGVDAPIATLHPPPSTPHSHSTTNGHENKLGEGKWRISLTKLVSDEIAPARSFAL